MSQNSSGGHGGSGGSGCGWFLGLLAMVAALGSMYVSVGIGAGSVTKGAVGLPAELSDLAGLLVVVALVALGMARRGAR